MGKLSQILSLDLSENALERASTYILSNLKDYKINIDEDRNIYVSKGEATFPAYVSSIDDVEQEKGSLVKRIVKNVWVGYEKVYDNIVPSKVAVGSKVSMYLAFKLLEKLENIKCVFKFTDNVSKLFFEDCRWVLELNGNGNTEILTSYRMLPVCSESFCTILRTIGKKYSYEIASSGYPGVSNLELPISMVSIPNGHYTPYTGFQQAAEADITKALQFSIEMAQKITSVCSTDDLKCGTCKKRLTRTEEYYCYTCCNTLRKTNLACKGCKGSLFTGKEFYLGLCSKCKWAAGRF